MSRIPSRFSFRRTTALVLLVSLLSPAIALARQSGSITGSPTFEAGATSSLFSSFSQSLGALLSLFQVQSQGMPLSERPLPERKAPQLPPTKAEREVKVASIKLDLVGGLTIESRQRRILMAIPLDQDGSPIHGLLAEWESSDKSIISITRDGRAVADKPGKATLTVSAGQTTISVGVTVIEAREQPKAAVGPASKVDRLREGREARAARKRTHHSSFVVPTPQEPQSQCFGSRLPDAEADSLYWAQNDVGAPPGRTEPGAATPPAAIAGTETPLSSNFSFGVPLVNLAGRGVDVKLALSYNSRLWHKSTDASGVTRLTYDVDSGWPAPGFQLGYGYIESHGTAGLTLVDGDGTRHELRKSDPNPFDYNYDTVDGTFIHFKAENGAYYPSQGWVDHANGTRAYYAGGTLSYPVQIMDRNGNYIAISYLGSGLIDTILDTQGRYIRFHYENSSEECGYKLVSISVPCFGDGASCPGGGSIGGGGSAGRQAVRLYYDTIPINSPGSFSVPTRAPATARVIRYVYFPGTQSGFRYNYSSYGMISEIKQLRGMTVSTTAATQQGTVTGEGQIAATTTYNYPQTPGSLSNTPAFTQRTDDWAGRTSAQSINSFSVNQAAGTVTTTAPNGTTTTTQSTVAQGQWNDGLVTDITQQGGGLTVTTHNDWEPDAGGVNPRVQQTQVTNEANQTRTTQFSYTSYNNVSVVKELGFNNEELRRTETTYETASQWTGTIGGAPPANRRLLRLPTSIKIFAGGATQPASWVVYAYDQGQGLTGRDGVVMHDEAYDPNSSYYDPATDYRGNLISTTRYINAADPNQGTVVDTRDHDILGNLVSQTVNCCRVRAYDYFSGYYFASVTQLTQGDTQHQENAVYDFNTGLMTQSSDQNNQVTTYDYYPDSLRLYRVTRPDGGYTITEYGDLLYADPDQSHLHSWTKTSTLIEGTSVAEEWKYTDGRGALVRTFGTQTTQGRVTTDTEYDAMGRVVRNSNPYYSQAGAASAINPAGLWATRQYDSLSRVTQVTLPDQTTAHAVYAGTAMTVTDQANKSRRRVSDALGRLVRIDEPDAAGNLGSASSPLQATSYQYDALDNLVHITQGAQHRYFKFDSLSRMTYERQPEQDAPHAAADPITGNSSWSRKILYNEFNLVSQVTDARSVATNFIYDTLNRLTQKNYTDGTTPTVQHSYDEVRYPDGGSQAYPNRGRLTTVSVGAGGIYQQFNYNGMGKVAMHRQAAGGNAFEIQYSYNPGGQLIEEWVRGERQQLPPDYLWTYTLDEKRSFFYDVAGRLTGVNRGSHSAPQAPYASALSYNAAAALESLTYGNGATSTMSYNGRLQLTSQSLVRAGVVLQQYDYQYGRVDQATGVVDAQKNNGQLGRMDAFIGGTPQSPVKQWEERFSYDALARLDVASEYRGDNGSLTWQTDYDYDRYGNRTSVSGIGYLAQAGSADPGSAGILPAMSAQREIGSSPTVREGSSSIYLSLSDSASRLLAFTAQPVNSHHASRSTGSVPSGSRFALIAGKMPALPARTNAASPQGPPPKIAFASKRDGSAQIYLMNTDGSGQTRLSNNPPANATNDESPRWSPDNSRILFQSDRDNPFCQLADIYVMNADGSGQTRLTTDVNDDSAPVWSPDGSKVAFQTLRNGVNYQVYVMNADGSGQVNLSNGSSNDGQPSWSPDGTKLAFTSDRDDPGRPSIYVMNANGSNQTRLTFTSAPFKDEQPVWSPDGSKLAFVSTRDSIIDTWQETDDEGGILTRTAVRTNKEVYLMNADGTNQLRLTNTLEHDDSPAWAADGAQIVFRSERERECCDPVPQVWIMNPDGSNQMNLSNNEFGDYGPGWQQAAGNVPPTVSLTSPANGATFTAPANITITASASDTGGVISKVDFYQGTALLGTDTTAPYSFDWSNVPAGIYSLTAKATDNGGATTTSTAVSITVNAVATVSYDSATNRITSAGVTYDGAGQVTDDARFRGLKYQYNPEGRMTSSANLDDSNPSTSVYDGLGQRVQTTQAGVTKRYFYNSNGSVVAEYEATGGTGYGVLKRLNVSGGGKLLAVDEVQTNGTKLISYVMADRIGSTRALMDAAGAVTSRHDYLPFGEELGAGTGAPGSPTGMRTAAQGYSVADNVRDRYAGTRLDDATGLDHTLWRKLETRSGRWTTPDPYGLSIRVLNPQSLNRYAYVHNDPVNSVDPSGLETSYNFSPYSDAEICRIFGIGCRNSGGGGLSDGGMVLVEDAPVGLEPLEPQNPRSEKLTKCANDSGLGSMLNNSNFNDQSVDFINRLVNAEGVDAGLLAFTFQHEGGFDIYQHPNTNNRNDPHKWDYGPFQLNYNATMADLAEGSYSADGLDLKAIFDQGEVFDAFQNGQLAARKLKWLLKASNGDYAVAAGRYRRWEGAEFTGRRDEWKNEGKQFQDFFKCFTSK